MHWDDRIFAGTHGKWSWIVVRAAIRDLTRLTVEQHLGQRLVISAFDSGPITPSTEERAIGWTLQDGLMISPPLSPDLSIPCDEYDEWYVFPALPKTIKVTDRYVNYLGFNLADPAELAASQDPTWDRFGFDWLIPLQQRFWSDIARLDPTSYVSSGDSDIVVTANPTFAKLVHAVAQEAVA